jgi:hypothetical protein
MSVRIKVECQKCESVQEDEYDGVLLILVKDGKVGISNHDIGVEEMLKELELTAALCREEVEKAEK